MGLKREHPEFFEQAKAYEKVDPESGEHFTWRQGESLDELIAKEELREVRAGGKPEKQKSRRNLPLVSVFADDEEELDPEDRPCLVCEL